jgi:hypothetical protein
VLASLAHGFEAERGREAIEKDRRCTTGAGIRGLIGCGRDNRLERTTVGSVGESVSQV